MSNKIFKSKKTAQYFTENRTTWAAFYPSERTVFDEVAKRNGGTLGYVLDVGCASGGLGQALHDKGIIHHYTGVEINKHSVNKFDVSMNWGAGLSAIVLEGDILYTPLPCKEYDTVISLSCIDWNVEVEQMLRRCWDLVKPGGNLIMSVRLVPWATRMDDQPIEDGEVAPYMILNWSDYLRLINNLSPHPFQCLGFGYWGTPSPTAQTPYKEIVFAVFSWTKPITSEGVEIGDIETPNKNVKMELVLPRNLFYV